jgi:hypothetical protein
MERAQGDDHEARADSHSLVAPQRARLAVEGFCRAKNKPSEAETKEMILRIHLTPAFGSRRLDQVGYAEIQDYAARKTKTLSPKTVNNHLTVLRRLLIVAKKRGLIEAVPEIEWLKVPRAPIR